MPAQNLAASRVHILNTPARAVARWTTPDKGVLLLTDDGDLAHVLMHPRFGVEKTVMVLDMAQFTRSVQVHGVLHFLARIGRMRRIGAATLRRVWLWFDDIGHKPDMGEA